MADDEEGKDAMSEGMIIITPSQRKPPKYNSDELIAGITKDYVPE